MRREGIIRRYRDLLPIVPDEFVVTLLEGDTPLAPAPNLARSIAPGTEIYLKYEGLNPTGSFKDRGMTMAVSMAKAKGADSVICASTGNTSASAAAYAARAGMKAYVLIPEGKIALGKLSQAMIHGAQVIQILGNFDEALGLVREISEKYPVTLVNSLNPDRIEGQKAPAFEICDALGDAPGSHAPPLRIGTPAWWKQAEAARDESGGLIRMVSDAEILEAYKLVAETEGIFCEPAAAATVAGVVILGGGGFFW